MVAPTPSSPPQSSNLGIDLKHLKTISALAEQGSPGRGRTPASTSPSPPLPPAQGAGDPLNLELFLERSRPLVTAAGQHLLALARQVLPALAQTERPAGLPHSSGEAGRLHLALGTTAASSGCSAVAGFRRQWPGVDLEVESVPGFPMPSMPRLAASSTCCSPRMQACWVGAAVRLPIHPAMAPDHPLPAKRRITPDDLRAGGAAGHPVERAHGCVQPFPATGRVEPPVANRWTTPRSCCRDGRRWLRLAALPRWASGGARAPGPA